MPQIRILSLRPKTPVSGNILPDTGIFFISSSWLFPRLFSLLLRRSFLRASFHTLPVPVLLRRPAFARSQKTHCRRHVRLRLCSYRYENISENHSFIFFLEIIVPVAPESEATAASARRIAAVSPVAGDAAFQ